jgi:hypothetical protein
MGPRSLRATVAAVIWPVGAAVFWPVGGAVFWPVGAAVFWPVGAAVIWPVGAAVIWPVGAAAHAMTIALYGDQATGSVSARSRSDESRAVLRRVRER